MNKLTLLIAAAAIVGFAGAASAHHGKGAHADSDWEAKGNQDCHVITHNETYKNPGKMFQAIRADTGENPVEWIEDRPAENVGDFIERRCRSD